MGTSLFDMFEIERPKTPQGSLSSLFVDDEDELDKELQKTAEGRAYRIQKIRARQLAQVDSDLAKPDLTPSAKTSLSALKTYLNSPEFGKLPRANQQKPEDVYINEDGMQVPTKPEAGRAALAGFLKSVPNLVDLPLAVAQSLGIHEGVEKLRGAIRETNARVDELTDSRMPDGIGKAAAEILGALANPVSLKGYNLAANVSGKVIGAGAGAVGAKGVQAAIKAGQNAANPLVRGATNVATGLPINIAQQAQMQDGTPMDERMKQMAIGVGSDLLGGMAFGGGNVRIGDAPVVKPKVELTTPVLDGAAPKNNVAAGILERNAQVKTEADLARAQAAEVKKYENEAKLQASAKYTSENLGKRFKNLDEAAQKYLIDEWKKDHDFEWFRSKIGSPNAGNSVPVVPDGTVAGTVEVGTNLAPEVQPIPVETQTAVMEPEVIAPPVIQESIPEIVPPKELSVLEILEQRRAATAGIREKLATETELRNISAENAAAEYRSGNFEALPTLDDMIAANKVLRKYADWNTKDSDTSQAEIQQASDTLLRYKNIKEMDDTVQTQTMDELLADSEQQVTQYGEIRARRDKQAQEKSERDQLYADASAKGKRNGEIQYHLQTAGFSPREITGYLASLDAGSITIDDLPSTRGEMWWGGKIVPVDSKVADAVYAYVKQIDEQTSVLRQNVFRMENAGKRDLTADEASAIFGNDTGGMTTKAALDRLSAKSTEAYKLKKAVEQQYAAWVKRNPDQAMASVGTVKDIEATEATKTPEQVDTPPPLPEPVGPTRKALEAESEALMDEMVKLDNEWMTANPGKNIREMANWNNPRYKEVVKRIVEVDSQLDGLPEESILETVATAGSGKQDDLYDRALAYTKTAGKYNTAGLQKEFKIGYKRAAELTKQLKAADVFATVKESAPSKIPAVDPAAVSANTEASKVVKEPDIRPPQVNMAKARKPKALKTEELQAYIDEAKNRIDNAMDPNMKAEWHRTLEKLVEEQVSRGIEARALAQIPPGVFGGAAGLTYGMVTEDESTTEGRARIWMWTMLGAGVGYGAGRYAKRAEVKALAAGKIDNLFPGQKELEAKQAKVISVADKIKPTKPFNTVMRQFYNGTVRRIASYESLVKQLPVNDLPLVKRSIKFAEHFNRSIARTESWFHNEVVIDGPDGEPLYLGPTFFNEDIKPMKAIQAMVEGDKDGLGKVAVALSSLELQAKGLLNTPFNAEYATLIIQNAPQNYIDAARELRKFNLGMLKVMQLAGRFSQESFERIAKEEWYTPLYREVSGGGVRNIRSLTKDKILMKDPFKARQHGSDKLPVINPVEQTETLLPYILRHHEYSNFVQSMLDVVRMQPPEIQKGLMRRVKSSDTPAIKEIEQAAKNFREAIPIGKAEAERLMVFKEEGADAAGNGGYITHWENGAISTYKVSDVLFDTAKGLLPFERDVLNNVVFGAARKTAQFAAKGVVNHPKFAAAQFIMDTFSSALTSKYGFRPGIDSFRGFIANASRSPEYMRLLDMGGPGSIQSLPYLNAESASRALQAEGKNALAVAWNHMRELHPIEAYKALAIPLTEAARVGEALRALDHGATTLDAVFAAREVGFNVGMEGSFTSVRAMHQITLFTRPGIQSADAMVRAFGRSPVEFLTKGTAYIMLPTVALWYANKDNEQIQKWRKTSVGKGYWFIQGPGEHIIRIRKPHVIGQMFGTAIEEALDEDPQAGEILEQLYRDTAVNMLPLFGVIPASLWGNKDMNTGIPINPEYQEGMEREFIGRDKASQPARVVSDLMFNVLTPAQTDYVAKAVSATIGADFLQGVTAAHEYVARGHPPAAEEWPIIRTVFQNPKSQSKELYEFYKNMEEIETVAKTMSYLGSPAQLAENGQRYVDYVMENKEKSVLIDTFMAERKQISEYRRAIEDLKKMQPLASKESLQQMNAEFRMLMELAAQRANTIHKAVMAR